MCVYVRVQTNQKVLLYLFKKELNAFFCLQEQNHDTIVNAEDWRLELKMGWRYFLFFELIVCVTAVV